MNVGRAKIRGPGVPDVVEGEFAKAVTSLVTASTLREDHRDFCQLCASELPCDDGAKLLRIEGHAKARVRAAQAGVELGEGA